MITLKAEAPITFSLCVCQITLAFTHVESSLNSADPIVLGIMYLSPEMHLRMHLIWLMNSVVPLQTTVDRSFEDSVISSKPPDLPWEAYLESFCAWVVLRSYPQFQLLPPLPPTNNNHSTVHDDLIDSAEAFNVGLFLF